MSVSTWVCPNSKCIYDKQLEPGQRCPLCGKEAKEFKFGELGDLFREKWDFKKSKERTKEYEQVLGRTKFCPKCGSTKLFWARGLPQLWSIWECKECSYRGTFILEDGKLAAKLREKWEKKLQESS